MNYETGSRFHGAIFPYKFKRDFTLSVQIVPMPEKLSRGNSRSTTSKMTSPRNIGMSRRQIRHVPDVCNKFQIGDEVKREFYSPNYPDAYPNQTDCVRVLEGKPKVNKVE